MTNYKIANIIFVRQACPDKPSVGDVVEYMGKNHFMYESTVTSVNETDGSYMLSPPSVKGKVVKRGNSKTANQQIKS